MKLPRREFLHLSAGGAALPVLFQIATAQPNDTAKQLFGSWKLTSWIIQVIGEGATEPLGATPKGRMIITPDGYMAVIATAADRKSARNRDETALLNSLLAYSGKFTIDGDKFTTKVDLSWNELFTGQDQVRFFKIEGDKLSIRTAEQISAALPNKKIVGIVTWEREH
jgi:lipocalin-like protein